MGGHYWSNPFKWISGMPGGHATPLFMTFHTVECCAHLKSLSACYNAQENMDRACVHVHEIFMDKYSELR